MATDPSEQSQEFCRILVLTEEGNTMGSTTTNNQLGLQLENPSQVDSSVISDSFPPCVVTVDIEQGGAEFLKIDQDICGNIKPDIALTKPLRRQNSLQTGGVAIQPLLNNILMLLKFDAKAEKQGLERAHDGGNNRWRKCKRPNLFDSRRIVILFSILSSMGTLVLIYLTLRVRQASDGYIHG